MPAAVHLIIYISGMADTHLTSETNGIRMGLLTAAVLIVYTGIAALAGFLDKIEAGSLDVVILAVGVVLAIKRFKQARGNRMAYLQGFGTGIITALIASVLLGAFFWLLGGISHRAVQQIEARDLFGADLGVLIGGLGIILVGTMTGVITSLVAMQYFKSPDHQPLASLE
ncbi:MAG: hypothetical protein NVS3B25_04370 [Hymenobacter sp.]